MVNVIDIDSIQAHGNTITLRHESPQLTASGVGASDISKLKGAGLYTVTVRDNQGCENITDANNDK